MRYQVESEVARLQQVIVHRPGVEMSRLTPGNMGELLFDDILWLERAQQEHDQFVEALASRGAEVMLLHTLLAETMAIDEARRELSARVFGPHLLGPAGAEALQQMAAGLGPHELADLLVAGLTRREVLERIGEPAALGLMVRGLDDFVIDPLPNHFFTRDTSCWVGGRVQVNAMALPARRREALNYEAIYRWHPRFAGVSRWGGVWPEPTQGVADGLWPDERGALEGGDVLVVGNGSVLVGLGERSTPLGAERLARRLFAASAANRLVAVDMPQERAMMHLDTVMTMFDEHSFIRYSGFGDRATWVMTARDDGGLSIESREPADFPQVLAQCLGVERVRLLTAPHDDLVAQREQWNDACNVLALEPGVVLGYERNHLTRRFLEGHGIEVIPVPGDELGRGRGGPRCMTCPTRRG